MKFSPLILALVFAFALPARAYDDTASLNPILKFVANFPGAKQFAVYSLITNRCDRYLTPRARQKKCHQAVKKKIDLLDFDVLMPSTKGLDENPHSFIILSFKKNLFELLSNPNTTPYLEELQQELSHFLSSGRSHDFNLWALTLKHFSTDILAAKAIATLFQDTSPAKMHILYLEKTKARGNRYFQHNKEMLMRVIDTIHLVSDYAGDHFQRAFYPREISQKLNRAIYHFYVPLYLSLSLQQAGIDKEFSAIAPLMMTLSYEFISTSSDYTYLYSDPKSIDPSTHDGSHKLRDILGGYSGVTFATNTRRVKTFQELGKAFTSSTKNGVELLLSNLN